MTADLTRLWESLWGIRAEPYLDWYRFFLETQRYDNAHLEWDTDADARPIVLIRLRKAGYPDSWLCSPAEATRQELTAFYQQFLHTTALWRAA